MQVENLKLKIEIKFDIWVFF